MGKKVSQLTSLSTYNGTAQVPVAVLSSSTVLTANTISFDSADNSINDSGNQLISSGLALNMALNVEGANNSGNNFYSGVITSLSASKAIISGVTLVTEAANNSITLNAWETHRTSFANVAISGSYDELLDKPTTADISDSSNKRYVTDAQLTVIGNTSGTNTGDQDLSGLVGWTTPENQHVITSSTNTFTISKSNGTIQSITLTGNSQIIAMDSDWSSGNNGELYILGVNQYTFTWPSGIIWIDGNNNFSDVTTGQWVRVIFERRTIASTNYWLFSKAGYITLS